MLGNKFWVVFYFHLPGLFCYSIYYCYIGAVCISFFDLKPLPIASAFLKKEKWNSNTASDLYCWGLELLRNYPKPQDCTLCSISLNNKTEIALNYGTNHQFQRRKMKWNENKTIEKFFSSVCFNHIESIISHQNQEQFKLNHTWSTFSVFFHSILNWLVSDVVIAVVFSIHI